MNNPSTHSAFVDFGDGTSAFIDGIPDECVHDWGGDGYLVSSKGKFITPHTYLKWAGYTKDFREWLIHLHHESIGDPITEGGCTCKHCGKPYHPPMF